METVTRQSNHAVDAIFNPVAGLLQRYSRYADEATVESMRVRFDVLQQSLLRAQSQSDIYEAFCVRNELRELRGMILEAISGYESQKPF